MKKKLVFLLTTLMCVFLFACDESSSKKTAEEEIIGKWIYYTGFTTWNFVFNEDMTCSYWSGASEPKNTTYEMKNGELTIAGLDWNFYYEILNEELKFWQDTTHSDGSKSEWKFTKDITYNPADITTLVLTKDMLDEIEEEYTSSSFSTILLFYMNQRYKNFEFTDWKITKSKKKDPYTYVVYCVLYAKDNYGDKYYQNSNIIFTAVEDDKEKSGYCIQWDIELVK